MLSSLCSIRAAQTHSTSWKLQGFRLLSSLILAKYGMNVIDCGVAVLNMHAPWEVIDKADLYETLKAYRAFLKYA